MAQVAVQVHAYGGGKDIRKNSKLVTDLPKPSPGQGEALVHMRVRPVAPADMFSIAGVYPGFQPKSLPAVPGLEGMGVIEEVGPGVKDLSVGQRVTPFLLNDYVKVGNGSYQKYIVVKEDDLVAVPDSVDDDAASQFVVNPLTAFAMLKELKVPQGEYVLQSGAGSALGRQFICMAKHFGLKTINVVRRTAQKEELKALGADEVISSSDEDVVARVKEITGGKGAYAAIDPVAGETLGIMASALRDDGTLLLYGAMSGFKFQAEVLDVLFRGVIIKGFWVTQYTKNLSNHERREFFDETMQLLESKIVEPFSGQKYELADYAEAIEKQENVARGGKFLLTSY